MNTFNPSDYSKIYENALLVYNISEEQALAEFLNSYTKEDKSPLLKAFLRDAEKLTKKKFDIKDIDKVTLTDIVKEIYLKTNRYTSDVAYQLYLKDKNQDKERANLANFFRKFTGNVVDEFLDIATPQGKFYFEKSGVFLLLDQQLFIVSNKNAAETSEKAPLKIGFKYLSHKIIYDKENKPYMRLKFENLELKNQISEFQLANEYELNKKNMYKVFPFKERQTFKADAFKEIDVQLYEDHFEIFAILDMDGNANSWHIAKGKINYKQ